MAAPNQTGVKQGYIEHLTFDHTLQPIATAGPGVIRTDFRENLEGHRSGLNAVENQTAAKITPVYTANGVSGPYKDNFRENQNRGNTPRF